MQMDRNLSLMTDMYQLTMAQGYFKSGTHKKQAVFNMFYRKNPCEGGYSIFAGLEQAIHYIKNFSLDQDDVDYLLEQGFNEEFVEYLRNINMDLTVEAVKEGSVIFPYEPLIQVKGDILKCQIIETAILTIVNHQILIATKASRIKNAARGRKVLEFGLRRAQGPDGGIYGARASYIGGFDATSNMKAGQMFGIPVSGTMAHSWVMSYDTELEAFRAYANEFPKKAILLVDTYDTLKSGVPNAIKVFNEMRAKDPSFRLDGQFGIRIDSGDLAYLSREARRMFDEAGFKDALISASNDLEEHTITSLFEQDARIDLFGVGTKNIVSDGCPALGGVYKLVELEGVPKIKVSENIEKITNPGTKTFFRLLDKDGMIIADYISLQETFGADNLAFSNSLELMDETHSWKHMTLEAGAYTAKQMLHTIMYQGDMKYEFPTLKEVRKYCDDQKLSLWSQYKRFANPPKMKVNLSNNLYDLKKRLLYEAKA